jgi:hypothetical protein
MTKRKPAALDQRQHIDAIAGAAALHQEDSAGAAEVGAGEHRHALLLAGQRHGMDLRVGQGSVDQNPVAGIGHIGELSDVVAAQQIVEIVLPPVRADAFAHVGCSLKARLGIILTDW